MDGDREVFIAFDSAKLKNAVAVAEAGRAGEVRYLGEIANTPEAVGKLVAKLAGKYDKLHFCYEAGPTGYGLYRQIVALGHACVVGAPSLIPKRPGDRVKTNRRDAVTLAKLSRAGELTAVWVPDVVHEAIRDLVRARDAAVADLRRKRQFITAFLLRHSRHAAFSSRVPGPTGMRPGSAVSCSTECGISRSRCVTLHGRHSFGSAAAIESSFSAASRRRSSSRRSPARWRLSSGRSLVRCHREQQWYEVRRERSASRHPPEKRVRVAKVRQGQPCGLPLARLAALTAFVASDGSASIGWKERNGPQPTSADPGNTRFGRAGPEADTVGNSRRCAWWPIDDRCPFQDRESPGRMSERRYPIRRIRA